MNALIVGGGGREHALAWKISQSPYIDKLYVAPGNAGIAKIATIVDIKADDIRGLASFAERNSIDLTIVGPENPLAMGIADYFAKRGLAVFGPSQKAALIESSKVFAKQFMQNHHIPTASFLVFDDAEKAIRFLEEQEFPIVIKTDGLAGGKGSIIAHNIDEARDAVVQRATTRDLRNRWLPAARPAGPTRARRQATAAIPSRRTPSERLLLRRLCGSLSLCGRPDSREPHVA